MTGNITFTKIPPLKNVIIKVLEFDPEDPGAGSAELEKIISEDQGICAKILMVSNSALYGTSKKISVLKEAIARLGLKTVKMLVIAMSAAQMDLLYSRPMFQKYLQDYHFLTAFLARRFAKKAGGIKVKEDEAFVAGLFQKIGMTIYALNESYKYEKILSEFDSAINSLSNLEINIFGADHTEGGKFVLTQWNMPQVYHETIGSKVRTLEEAVKAGDFMKLITLSDLVSLNLIKGSLGEEEKKILEFLIKYLNFGEDITKITPDFLKQMKNDPMFSIG